MKYLFTCILFFTVVLVMSQNPLVQKTQIDRVLIKHSKHDPKLDIIAKQFFTKKVIDTCFYSIAEFARTRESKFSTSSAFLQDRGEAFSKKYNRKVRMGQFSYCSTNYFTTAEALVTDYLKDSPSFTHFGYVLIIDKDLLILVFLIEE